MRRSSLDELEDGDLGRRNGLFKGSKAQNFVGLGEWQALM